ncbi:MAG TPA: hypothetical protein VII82_13080 [Polyangiaceae bacterium]|jgi:hypothetical protein
MGFHRARVALIALAAPAFVAVVGGGALAQSKAAGTRTLAANGRGAARSASPKKPTVDGGATSTGGLVAAAPTTLPTSGGPADAGVVEAKTLDGGTHVFKFSELDIEGRLKSPQLVYFLRRVRAEFAAGDLGHRSFMREMSETRKESSF